MRESAARFIEQHARPLELAQYRVFFAEDDPNEVVEALLPFQNADGGFGHALEPDNWNPIPRRSPRTMRCCGCTTPERSTSIRIPPSASRSICCRERNSTLTPCVGASRSVATSTIRMPSGGNAMAMASSGGIPRSRWPRSSSACMRKALGRHCSPRRSTRWSSPVRLPATNSPASYSHGNCSTVNRLKASLTSTSRAPRSSAQTMPPSAETPHATAPNT